MAWRIARAANLPLFLLVVTFLAVFVVFATGFSYYYYQRDQLKTLTRNNLSSVADLKVGQIENWLSERGREAKIIHDNAVFSAPLFSWLDNKRSPELKKEIENWMAGLCGDTGYAGIALLDRQGKTTIYYRKNGESDFEYEQNRIDQAEQGNKIVMGDIHKDSKGNIKMDMYVPLRDKNQSGLLVFRINPSLFLYPLIQSWPVPSESAETLLVQIEGKDIVYLNELRHKNGTAFNLRFPVSNQELPAAQVIRGNRDLIISQDYRGVRVMAVGRPVPGTGWYLIAKIDSNELYKSMIWIGLRASLFAAVIIVLLGAGLYFGVSNQSAAELKESKDIFERLVSASPDAVTATDLEGKITYVSEEVLKSNGARSREELIDKSYFLLIAPEGREAARGALQSTLESGLVKNQEFTFLRPDGSRFIGELNAALTKTGAGKAQGFIITVRDVTSQKNMERVVKESAAQLALQNDHLQKTQELALVGSWDLDVRNDVLTWTDETFRIFGVPAGTPLNYAKFISFIHPEDRDGVNRAWQAALGTKTFDLEHRILANGQIKWVREKAELQIDRQGQAVRAIGAVLDITEYKRLVSVRDEFVSTVSHELRTPMAIIHEGVAQVLEGLHGPINEGQNRFLSATLRNLDRLGRIINDLLDISRLESGKMEAIKEPIDFARLARETAAAFRAPIDKKGLEFVERIPDVPIMLSADRDELVEVLTNLLGNAIKFTERGRIELEIRELGQEVECSVADTGRGIAQRNMPKLFEKFTQFGRIAGGGEKGTGLGLAIVKSLIELHDGRIRVESIENAGSKFIFTLPKNLV